MPMSYTSGTHIDHYEIIRMLGHGGMNRVYLAKDTHNQQEVVLKIPNDDMKPKSGIVSTIPTCNISLM